MTVNQTTDKVIAEWDTFNIGTNDSVAFAQPGASSIALNRISDQSASHTDTWFTHGQRPGIPPGLQWGYIRVNGTGQDLGFVGKENQIANLIGPETGSETLAAYGGMDLAGQEQDHLYLKILQRPAVGGNGVILRNRTGLLKVFPGRVARPGLQPPGFHGPPWGCRGGL